MSIVVSCPYGDVDHRFTLHKVPNPKDHESSVMVVGRISAPPSLAGKHGDDGSRRDQTLAFLKTLIIVIFFTDNRTSKLHLFLGCTYFNKRPEGFTHLVGYHSFITLLSHALTLSRLPRYGYAGPGITGILSTTYLVSRAKRIGACRMWSHRSVD